MTLLSPASLPPEGLLTADLESFAVDPNEVLKKDCVSVKEEPLEESPPSAAFAVQPGMYGCDMSLQAQIKSEPNSPMSSSSSSLVSLVSQYGGGGGGGNASDVSECGGGGGTLYEQGPSSSSSAMPSRVPLPHFQRPQRNGGPPPQPPSTEGGSGDVLDLVMPPVDYEAMEEDIDLTGVHLNEQDFHSIKSIVEQTFRDGRDMLDIIEAV